MQVITNLEQNSEEWRIWRKPRIGGSDDKGIKPLSRGKLKGLVEGAVGFWQLVANTYAIEKDIEDERERGHRLEAENLMLTNLKCGTSMSKAGVWISNFSEYVHISPDGADEGDSPIHAFEGKAFDTHKHLSVIYFDLLEKKKEDYNPIFSLPVDNQDQAIKYFNVSETLEVLHWAMINEMVVYDELCHYVIDIKREHVANLIDAQQTVELAAINKRTEVIKFMLNELKTNK